MAPVMAAPLHEHCGDIKPHGPHDWMRLCDYAQGNQPLLRCCGAQPVARVCPLSGKTYAA